MGIGNGEEPQVPAPETIEELLACREAAMATAADLEAQADAAILLGDSTAAAGLRTRASIELARAAIYGTGAVLADALRAWISTGDDTTFTPDGQES